MYGYSNLQDYLLSAQDEVSDLIVKCEDELNRIENEYDEVDEICVSIYGMMDNTTEFGIDLEDAHTKLCQYREVLEQRRDEISDILEKYEDCDNYIADAIDSIEYM